MGFMSFVSGLLVIEPHHQPGLLEQRAPPGGAAEKWGSLEDEGRPGLHGHSASFCLSHEGPRG